MGLHYIPGRAADLAAWASNFSALILANPGAYALTASDAAYLQGYVSAYLAALGRCCDPSTRTAAAVAAKDSARAAMVARGYAQPIRLHRGISSAAKIALGVSIGPVNGPPLPAPVGAPILMVIAAQPLEHTLRYADQAAPTRRGKPRGVSAMQLFCAVAPAPPVGPGEARFRGLVTRQPLAVSFTAAERGQSAWYFARWQTPAGRVGPWSAMAGLGIV